MEKGNHVKFQVSKGKNGFKAVNIQRRYSGRVKLTKESYGFVIYKVIYMKSLRNKTFTTLYYVMLPFDVIT